MNRMSIRRPFQEWEDFLLGRYAGAPEAAQTEGQGDSLVTADWRPAVDISETPESYQIHLDLPAVDPGKVDVSVKGDVIQVSGSRERKQEHKDDKAHRVERSYGRFMRSFALPEDADPGNIAASSQNGELALVVGKRAKDAGSRSIEIKPA